MSAFNVLAEDIENEARTITSIREKGGHANIIEILNHGWLKGSLNVYFIDMELGSCTLTAYIASMNPANNFTDDSVKNIPSSDSTFVTKFCPNSRRMENMWLIGAHISRALEFMHRHALVHRDLKPSNGTFSKYFQSY